ncbi:MAG TPA: hypothetical protein VK864_03295, partial [Longimicrobiales bacterium]|nr:hypothetical protein [Longimicrobiales bacterium]
MIYRCCNDRRREIIERLGTINGIAALEVVDQEATIPADRQRFLRVSFILPPAGALLSVTPANVRILGGEWERDLQVLSTPIHANVLVVEVDRPGDFSPYRLRLVDTADPTKPLAGLDPLLSEIEFSFKVECRQDFDCAQRISCPPAITTEPELDYLARDYDSFRRIILDRLSLLSPSWTERHEADLGMVLAELLAYVGDRLSYRQDAIATEAYLHTALRRTSIRRHARLVDYRMHDGASARVWVHLLTTADHV